MLVTVFYAISSIMLSIMIANANEPVIDYSHLSKPTTTFPPAPAPIDTVASPVGMGVMISIQREAATGVRGEVGSIIHQAWKLTQQWQLLWTSRRRRRHSRRDSYMKGSATRMLKQQLGRPHAGGPEKSTYSPPAAYSEYPIESYGQQRLNSK
jgi:hypothetical protein